MSNGMNAKDGGSLLQQRIMIMVEITVTMFKYVATDMYHSQVHFQASF